MAEGKDHDAIIATFIRDFGGQDILIEPNDKGLNRFAWALSVRPGGIRRHCAAPLPSGSGRAVRRGRADSGRRGASG